MDHSSSMPLTEAIAFSTLSSTYSSSTSMDARIEAAQAAETAKIANMTTDDESNKPVAPSLQDETLSMFQKKSNDYNNTSDLFNVPAELLQQPQQLVEACSTEPSSTIVYHISARQYNNLQSDFSRHPLPSDSLLFPWLHGVNGTNYQECLFFGVRRMVVPKHRGLVLIHGHDSTSSSRLVQSFLPEDILTGQDKDDWVFRDTSSTREKPGIHLRNFKIQPWRYASISDIVVYGNQAETIARRISMAQRHIYQERQLYHQRLRDSSGRRAVVNSNDITYRIFIISDTFDTFEKCFPELVWYNHYGLAVNNICFLEREKKEMREMSSAKELTDNIWVGNTYDSPASMNRDEYSDDMNDDIQQESADDYDENPNRYSVCIECHDLSDMPLPSILTLARETLNELGQDDLPSEVIHLDMYSTGTVIDTIEQMDSFLSNLEKLLEFMDDISQKGRRILVHCADGYTETSILCLTWLMYKKRLTLPMAYLYLQDQQSFFVSSSDISFLRRIEHYIQGKLATSHCQALESNNQHQKRKREETTKIELSASLPNVQLYDTSTSTTSPAHHKVHVRSLYDDRYINAISNGHISSDTDMDDDSMDEDIDETIIIKVNQGDKTTRALPPIQQPVPSLEQMTEHPWFFSPRFEGSFPSRIMPYLYLGNLNHATNPGMLKVLGITHIVSVGENANLDPQHFKLLYLDNLYDDGIDSIRNRYDEAMSFIDEAFSLKTKCLVHCRVGVSRSAAITICYVMHRFQTMSLVDAYIFVRARRLNVIIQPNLKFVYEMLQLEQIMLGKTNLSWPVLCHQIHLLNETYDED